MNRSRTALIIVDMQKGEYATVVDTQRILEAFKR
jgi:nicotinamidase-related amidase